MHILFFLLSRVEIEFVRSLHFFFFLLITFSNAFVTEGRRGEKKLEDGGVEEPGMEEGGEGRKGGEKGEKKRRDFLTPRN